MFKHIMLSLFVTIQSLHFKECGQSTTISFFVIMYTPHDMLAGRIKHAFCSWKRSTNTGGTVKPTKYNSFHSTPMRICNFYACYYLANVNRSSPVHDFLTRLPTDISYKYKYYFSGLVAYSYVPEIVVISIPGTISQQCSRRSNLRVSHRPLLGQQRSVCIAH